MSNSNIADRGAPAGAKGLELLPESMRAVFAQPPPRKLPRGFGGRCARAQIGPSFWVGIALLLVGGFYTLVFLVLKAPWQIPAGSGTVALLGATLLFVYLVQVVRLKRLLRTGIVLPGKVEAVARVGADSPHPVFGTSVEFQYVYAAPSGENRRATSFLLWNPLVSELETGSQFAVCCDSRHPRRHIPLLAITT